MHAILALDKFKGTFSAQEACELVARGIRKRNPKVISTIIPMADGGEGTAELIASKLGMEAFVVTVPDWNGTQTKSCIYWDNKQRVALVESATVLGLESPLGKQPIQENALFQSNSFALGKLIQKALELRPIELWIAIGGTLTADAGWGLATALGVTAQDFSGNILYPCLENMEKITSISLKGELSEALQRTRVRALCDVNAPAAPVSTISLASFLPQKGATPAAIPLIEKRITHLWKQLQAYSRPTLDLEKAGTGAGGGLCLGLSSVFPNLHIELGAERLARVNNLAAHIAQANVVVCGEGCLDDQTFYGKAPTIVSKLGKKANVPVFGIFGQYSGKINIMKEKLDAKNIHFLFEKLPHTHTELIRQSELRLIETGVAIAHWLETSAL